MKLLSFSHQGQDRWGVLHGATVYEWTSSATPSLRSALSQELFHSQAFLVHQGVDDSRPQWPLSALKLLPPITDPDKILCIGVNYPSHAGETGRPANLVQPSVFVRFPSSQVGHEAPVICPRLSSKFDYEGELAVIIGKRARHIREEEALNVVAGYSCFAENSARDFQGHSTQVTAGKNFHHSGAFGPWLVTPDEIGKLQALELQTRLNGQIVQQDKLGNMLFSVQQLIAYISSFTELLPGDVIATGTPAGVGALRQPPIFLKPGDHLEVDIQQIGLLSNRLIAE
mgnify:CR=1 FL=1|jgi:2-keto-4-pentenoate hydratase/2-oxohepta-3-ene-1,7-dioic acid hydratase in catechol pathway